MSTELKSIRGRIECVKDATKYEVEYKPQEIHLTRFYGGKKNGAMLQITLPISKDDFFTHIQLTKKQIKKLVDTLQTEFLRA